MERQIYRFRLRKNERFYIVPIGDLHYGTKDCDMGQFLRTIEYIAKKPNCYIVGIGDLFNFTPSINRNVLNSLRGDARLDVDMMAYGRVEKLAQILHPVKKRILGLLEGNHFYTFGELNGWQGKTTTECLCEMLKVPYLGEGVGYIILSFIRGNSTANLRLDMFLHHGRSAGRTGGISLNELERLTQGFEADIYVLGHSHRKIAEPSDVIYISPAPHYAVRAKRKLFVRAGSFVKGYELNPEQTSYIEKNLYPPVQIGVAKIIIELKSAWEGSKEYIYLDYHVSL